ncbi:MAG: hypothetical protein M3M94_00320 [Actinomycetota bacterium]|nr:hypothetical protein [Actinomycetota bacterium]
MRRFIADMNPLVRGLLIVALIAGVIVVLQLQATLTALFLLARIAFFLAIAFFVYLMWRERRSEIGSWSTRAQTVFYGAALLIVVDLATYFFMPVAVAGMNAVAFFLILGICAFAMWRVWRDERRYSL